MGAGNESALGTLQRHQGAGGETDRVGDTSTGGTVFRASVAYQPPETVANPLTCAGLPQGRGTRIVQHHGRTS